jgi:hypothetical protein
MSLFGFGNISFNKDSQRTQGPLKALEGSTEFQSTALRYPSDVGNFDKAHYMVFYIRQQNNTSYPRSTTSDTAIDADSVGRVLTDVPLVGNIGTNLGGDLLNKINSGLNTLNSATGGALSGLTGSISGALGGIQSGINNLFGQAASVPTGDAAATSKILSTNIAKITNNSFLKTTSLTTDAIALYMPDTLMYTHSQTYDQIGMGGEIAGQVLAAGRGAMDAFKQGENLTDSIKKAASQAGDALALNTKQGLITKAGSVDIPFLGSNQNAARVIGASVLGAVKNPMLEMIYSSPNFRTFQFEFSFYPRDEKEALEVQRIIERFRFHQAPEFRKETQGFLIPPSEFDIRFYYGGFQNSNIPKISTCVLTSVDVNYAPNGFSAYEIPGESQPSLGRTGMPVAITMNLQFTEKTYLTKSDFTSEEEFAKAGAPSSSTVPYDPR